MGVKRHSFWIRSCGAEPIQADRFVRPAFRRCHAAHSDEKASRKRSRGRPRLPKAFRKRSGFTPWLASFPTRRVEGVSIDLVDVTVTRRDLERPRSVHFCAHTSVL
jgi:hypothetical protein